jgi:hypothetical protein
LIISRRVRSKKITQMTRLRQISRHRKRLPQPQATISNNETN